MMDGLARAALCRRERDARIKRPVQERNMSEAGAGTRGCDVVRENGNAAATGADILYLAAAPTFAVMALLTAFGGSPDALCAVAGTSPFGGMVPMYLLMSAFHLAPWLKLISRS
jgi:hypothetical protein